MTSFEVMRRCQFGHDLCRQDHRGARFLTTDSRQGTMIQIFHHGTSLTHYDLRSLVTILVAPSSPLSFFLPSRRDSLFLPKQVLAESHGDSKTTPSFNQHCTQSKLFEYSVLLWLNGLSQIKRGDF